MFGSLRRLVPALLITGLFVTALPQTSINSSQAMERERDNASLSFERQETNSAEEFASALTALKTDEERAQLLETKKELVTNELLAVLIKRGKESGQKSDFKQGLIFDGLALSVAEKLGDRRGMVSALNLFGGLYFLQSNYDSSLAYSRKALALGEQIEDKAGQALALLNIGICYWQKSDYNQALENFNKGLELYTAINDKLGMARALADIGIINRLQGNYNLAIASYQKALPLAEEAGDKIETARIYNNLGVVNNALGNSEIALDFYRKSLSQYEAAGLKSRIAGTLTNMSIVYRFEGNYRLALEDALKSLKLATEIGDRLNTAIAFNAAAAVYSSQGEAELALEYQQKYLAISEEIGNKSQTAFALFDIGMSYFRQGEIARSLDYHLKSLKLREQIGEKASLAESFLQVGSIYEAQGKYDLALEFYRKSLALDEEISNNRGTVTSFAALADFYYKKGSYKEALESAERAAGAAKQAGLQEQFWQARTLSGRAYRALGRFQEAHQAFDEAINAIESLRTQIAGGAREQQRSFERRVSPYVENVKLLIAEGRTDEALLYAERARARALLDVLQNGKGNVTKAMTAEEQAEESRLRGNIRLLNARLTRERSLERQDPNLLTELNAQLQKARLDFEAFQKSLYAAHPELKTNRGEAQNITLEQASGILPDTKTALIEYLITDEQTYLFVLTKTQAQKAELKVYPLDIRRDKLEKGAENYRQQLASLDPDFSQAGQALYDILLRPARAQLEGKTRLVIIPDQGLWNLPFHALQPAAGHYLIENQSVSYAPSLTVLREMIRLRRRNSEGATASSPLLLAFGNPLPSEQALTSAKLVTRSGLGPLPETEKEVKALEQVYGTARSKVYVGQEAREETVKSKAGKYQIVHLATHGILDEASPLYSYLLLSRPSGADSPEDGLLEAWEIMGMDLRADLVVLSACETARGRIGTGEGVIGLSWAFFVAGTPTTVVSQWKVESKSTELLMTEFHRNLEAALRKPGQKISEADALREAILKLNKNELYRHPFYWAAFIVVGDGF